MTIQKAAIYSNPHFPTEILVSFNEIKTFTNLVEAMTYLKKCLFVPATIHRASYADEFILVYTRDIEYVELCRQVAAYGGE